MEYRNVRTGRVVERHAADEWLEASAGWERVEDVPEPTPEAEPAVPADDDTPEPGEDNERTDDDG